MVDLELRNKVENMALELKSLGLASTLGPNLVSDADISYIESQLNISLPDDYVWFLKKFGNFRILIYDFGLPYCIDGVSLDKSGNKNFDVVDNTLKYRESFQDVPDVVELSGHSIVLDGTDFEYAVLYDLKFSKVLLFENFFDLMQDASFLKYFYETMREVYADKDSDEPRDFGPDNTDDEPDIKDVQVFIGRSNLENIDIWSYFKQHEKTSKYIKAIKGSVNSSGNGFMFYLHDGMIGDYIQLLLKEQFGLLVLPDGLDFSEKCDFMHFRDIGMTDITFSGKTDYSNDEISIKYVGDGKLILD